MDFTIKMAYFLPCPQPSNRGSAKHLDIVPHRVQHKRRIVRRRVPLPHARLAIALATLSSDPCLVERVDSGPIYTVPPSSAPRHRPHSHRSKKKDTLTLGNKSGMRRQDAGGARAGGGRDAWGRGRGRADPPVHAVRGVAEADDLVVQEGHALGVAERGQGGFVPGHDGRVVGCGGLDAGVSDGHGGGGGLVGWWILLKWGCLRLLEMA